MPFICEKCGYGCQIDSGVPVKCPCCEEYFTFRRAEWEEYCKCETTDGKDEIPVKEDKEHMFLYEYLEYMENKFWNKKESEVVVK